ncbi:TatD family hydrolase [Vaginisenegalia massiliensis]|uniref:TatD family hydrolase n=1 Tax=Vaginisenegalia massiliensis TaxID=2058294 RepID=UPI000F535B2D|nr:TatD family hydrolase [Vaginisenegalia massiliensis]
MPLFDTHTHLNAQQFVGREVEIVEAALAQDVAYLAVVGFDQDTIEKSLQLSQQFANVISVVGWHPTEAESYTPEIETKLYEWLQAPKVQMLGEIGLDYYWDTASKSKQDQVFRRQIGIAKELNLPITIHNREATEDCYRILKEEGLPQAGGIMHSFGGNAEEAKQFLDLGMHISFSGVLTFKKAEEVRQAASVVPMDRLLVETDAPYLTPVPYRGKENQPQYVRLVAEELARVKGVDYETLAKVTTDNAFKLFNWRP